MTAQQKRHQAIGKLPETAKARATTYGPDLYVTALALYNRLCNITTEDFSKGGEKVEREALAAALTEVDCQVRD